MTENHIEQLAIENLQKEGYQYCYGPTIAPDGDSAERESFEQVLLLGQKTEFWQIEAII
jgi:type I restriction enzyme R subunit